MKLRAIAAALAIALTVAPATARPHHHRHHYTMTHSVKGHPSFPWCGWFMTRRKGVNDTSLYAARNWARWGRPSTPKPGAVVVWPHHVGELVRHIAGSVWEVLSGNDGHAVRSRPRSISGVIAVRS